MEKPVIIFGAKGIAKSSLEIFQINQVTVYGFLDDDKSMHQQTINDVPVLGLTDDQRFTKLIGKKCEAFIAYDDYKIRSHMTKMLIESRKVMPVNAIHDKALITKSVDIGHGNFINANRERWATTLKSQTIHSRINLNPNLSELFLRA